MTIYVVPDVRGWVGVVIISCLIGYGCYWLYLLLAERMSYSKMGLILTFKLCRFIMGITRITYMRRPLNEYRPLRRWWTRTCARMFLPVMEANNRLYFKLYIEVDDVSSKYFI